MKICLNPEYVLKNDNGRVLILTKDSLRSKIPYQECVIHPIYAQILSFFNGVELNEGILSAAKYLNVSEAQVEKMVVKLIHNEKTAGVKKNSVNVSAFPPDTLIYSDEKPEITYTPEQFNYDLDKLDLKIKRHKTPTAITFMATTQCMTNCIYCYADRRNIPDPVDIAHLKRIIAEARSLEVAQFDVIGGEFFLYKEWKELLTEMYNYNFRPYISTKMPIDEAIILSLKEIGVKDIQISLDTLIPDHLSKILRVNQTYHSKIIRTLELLDKHAIAVNIHTILTEYNHSVEDMDSIYQFIRQRKNVKLWKIDPASSTLYEAKDRFSSIKISREKLSRLCDYFQEIKKDDRHFEIVSGDLADVLLLDSTRLSKEDKKSFYTNQRGMFCSANDSNLFILPDGQVTICEELYWKPQFIIGDIKTQSLHEIWYSEKALNLYYLKQEQIRDVSPCKKCTIFENCRQDLGGVCWKEIIKAYGEENWDFPDPKCPKSPEVKVDIYV